MKPIAPALVIPAHADDTDLARKPANPVADLISVPIQGNVDLGIEPGENPGCRGNARNRSSGSGFSIATPTLFTRSSR